MASPSVARSGRITSSSSLTGKNSSRTWRPRCRVLSLIRHLSPPFRPVLAQYPGAPNGGTFGGSSTSRKFDEKRLVKIDWNIAQHHRMSVRYSDTKSAQPNFGSFNYTSFSQPVGITGQPSSMTNSGTGLASAFYTLAIQEKVWAAQLFSNWTPDLKTEFDYSNTQQDSVRAVPIAFPEIRIFNVPGISQSGVPISTADAFRLGSEISSQGNGSTSRRRPWPAAATTRGATYVHRRRGLREEQLPQSLPPGRMAILTIIRSWISRTTTPSGLLAPSSRPAFRWLISANSTAPVTSAR